MRRALGRECVVFRLGKATNFDPKASKFDSGKCGSIMTCTVINTTRSFKFKWI